MKTCQNQKIQIVYYKSYTLTKMSYFSVFLSRIMQNSGKGWTRDQNIDSYEEISFFVKYAVFIKNENGFLKNSDFWYTWSHDHIQQVFQISERSDQYSRRYDMLKYHPIGIALFCIEAKSRKYQGVLEMKSRVKTWQVRGTWSQQFGALASPKMGDGTRCPEG